MTETGSKGKRSKEEVKAFFDWQRSYRERLFQHSETKRNWRIFALGYFLSDKFDWGDRSCFYGRERLAAELGVDVRTVTNLTKQLAKMGFIRIKRQGREKPSRYIGTIPPDVKSDAHQEVKLNAHRASGKQASMGNSTLPDVKSNSVSMCNGFPPNDSFQRTLERKGAAEAAPHNGKNAEDKLRGDGLEGRPPTGDRDEYPAGEQTEVHPFDDEEIFAHDDDGEGIPYDDGEGIPFDAEPARAASEQREAPHRDVLAQCLRRADELGEHEQRLTHILAIRLREGHQFSEADRNALAAICRRLSIQFPVDGPEDFADDLAAVRPDLSPPSARKTTEA